jgi:hypothetical protein
MSQGETSPLRSGEVRANLDTLSKAYIKIALLIDKIELVRLGGLS